MLRTMEGGSAGDELMAGGGAAAPLAMAAMPSVFDRAEVDPRAYPTAKDILNFNASVAEFRYREVETVSTLDASRQVAFNIPADSTPGLMYDLYNSKIEISYTVRYPDGFTSGHMAAAAWQAWMSNCMWFSDEVVLINNNQIHDTAGGLQGFADVIKISLQDVYKPLPAITSGVGSLHETELDKRLVTDGITFTETGGAGEFEQQFLNMSITTSSEDFSWVQANLSAAETTTVLTGGTEEFTAPFPAQYMPEVPTTIGQCIVETDTGGATGARLLCDVSLDPTVNPPLIVITLPAATVAGVSKISDFNATWRFYEQAPSSVRRTQVAQSFPWYGYALLQPEQEYANTGICSPWASTQFFQPDGAPAGSRTWETLTHPIAQCYRAQVSMYNNLLRGVDVYGVGKVSTNKIVYRSMNPIVNQEAFIPASFGIRWEFTKSHPQMLGGMFAPSATAGPDVTVDKMVLLLRQAQLSSNGVATYDAILREPSLRGTLTYHVKHASVNAIQIPVGSTSASFQIVAGPSPHALALMFVRSEAIDLSTFSQRYNPFSSGLTIGDFNAVDETKCGVQASIASIRVMAASKQYPDQPITRESGQYPFGAYRNDGGSANRDYEEYTSLCRAYAGGSDQDFQPLIPQYVFDQGALQWYFVNLTPQDLNIYGQKPPAQILSNTQVNVTFHTATTTSLTLVAVQLNNEKVMLQPVSGRVQKTW